MTISDWLQETTAKGKDAGIASARLDALVLLEFVLQTQRATLLAHPETPLPATTLAKLNAARTLRLSGVPLAYILHKKEFYGRDFMVNEHVLIPRPETEHMIDIVKQLCKESPSKILDMGTGSGCIAITLGLEVPGSSITASDVSDEALAIARLNAKALGAQVTFKKTDMFAGLEHKTFDIVCANLPYVPDGLITSLEITKEPALALFSGTDGLDHYRRLFAELPEHAPTYVIVEVLETQRVEIESIALSAGYVLREVRDLVLCFKLNN